MTLAKHDYKPGEQVEIAIRAPYAGSGLITIERDKVYAHAWFHADTTSSIQHITVPAGFEGNGYINVQYIRDPSSDEIFMAPLSYGVVPFSVNLDARRNAVSVDAPALVKPGDTVNFISAFGEAFKGRGVRGRRGHPAGRALQARRSAEVLLPQADARSRHVADPRPDPAGLREADGDGRAGRRRRRCNRSPVEPVQAQARQAGRLLVGDRRRERRHAPELHRARLLQRQAARDGCVGIAGPGRYVRRGDDGARRFRAVAECADDTRAG